MFHVPAHREEQDARAQYIQISRIQKASFKSDRLIEQEVCKLCKIGHGYVRGT